MILKNKETVKNHYGKFFVLYAADSFYKDYTENEYSGIMQIEVA
jgi:hypothetical protein